MEPKFQTSFIPKKPIGSSQGSSTNLVHATNIFSVIATVVFIVTVLTSVGLFFYKNILTKQIDEADKIIIASEDAYKPDEIKQLIDANARIISARKLLENHIVVSRLLDIMQSLTVRKMKFNELNYAGKDNAYTLNILGEVQTYNALAEQQDVFLKNEYIKEPSFSNFTLGDNGYISVNFSAKIDPRLVSYKKAMESIPLN